MDRERDDRTGRYTTKYPLSDFVEVLADADEMPTTQEIADEVGCSYDLAYRRLRELEDDGKAAHRDVGRSFIWRLVE